MYCNNNILLNKCHKSVGQLTYQTWKNKQIVRAKPHPSQAHISENQQNHRDFWKMYTSIVKGTRTIINVGLKIFAKKKQPLSYFQSINYTKAFQSYNEHPVIDLTELIFANGELNAMKLISSQSFPPNEKSYLISNKYHSYEHVTGNYYYVYVLNPDTYQIIDTGKVNATINISYRVWHTRELYGNHCYIIAFFYNEISKKAGLNLVIDSYLT